MSQGQGLTNWECLIEALPCLSDGIRSNESSESIPLGIIEVSEECSDTKSSIWLDLFSLDSLHSNEFIIF